jgi:alpha-L-arabinofuranosidase
VSFYNWRNYVGPRDTRENSTSFYWGGLDDNDAAIDEFLQLCEVIDCEPQICINMMSSTPYKAAELIEYLNGDDNTSMGRYRKENGVTRNRKVRFIELDNEAGRKWTALQYAEQVVDYAKAMKAVEPDIQLMMMFYSFDYGNEYFEQMLKIAGKHIDYVIHRNGSPVFVNKTLQTLRKYNKENGTDIKLTNSEWLADGNSPEPFEDKEIPQRFGWRPQLQDSYKKVLSFRQIHWFYALNGAGRLLDYLSYGGEYYLANFNNCVNTWGQNVIESSKEGAWLSPMGEVFRFFAAHDDLYPLQTRLIGEQPKMTHTAAMSDVENDPDVEFPLIVNRQSETTFYKVVACETEKGTNLYLVNKSTESVTLQLQLPVGCTASSIRELYAPDRLSRTYMNHSDLETGERKLKNSRRITIKPLSVSKITID